jgi:beta-mannosidase
VVAVNDADRTWTAALTVTRRTLAGDVLAKDESELTVAARSSGRAIRTANCSSPRRGERRALWFFVEDPVVAFPPAAFSATTEPVPGGWQVRVTADTLLRELALFPDRLAPDAVVDDQHGHLHRHHTRRHRPGRADPTPRAALRERDPA